MNIEIREYKPSEDSEALLDFYNNLSEEDRYKRFHGLVKDFREYLESFSRKTGVMLLAYHNSELVGVCEAYKVNEEEWEVAIIVSKKYRKLGIGRRLLKEIAKRVKKMGGSRLYGIVSRDNYEAINFGKKVGCKIIDNDSYTVKIFFELCDDNDILNL